MEPISRSPRVPVKRNWSPKRINRELRARGFRQVDVVQATGRSQSTVSEVISAKVTSLPTAEAIAALLDRRPWEIWPRRYAEPATSTGETKTAPTAEPEPIPHAS
jgi:lambda repressor-like predicted transcriptional regulator